MSILIDVIGLLAVLANTLLALHIWSVVSAGPIGQRAADKGSGWCEIDELRA